MDKIIIVFIHRIVNTLNTSLKHLLYGNKQNPCMPNPTKNVWIIVLLVDFSDWKTCYWLNLVFSLYYFKKNKHWKYFNLLNPPAARIPTLNGRFFGSYDNNIFSHFINYVKYGLLRFLGHVIQTLNKEGRLKFWILVKKSLGQLSY